MSPSVVLLLAVILPAALATATVLRPLRPSIARIAPLATAPALVLVADGGSVETSWLLLGARLGATDTTSRGFLALTALVWAFAAWFARAYLADSSRRGAFWFFFLTTMCGNLGVALARDVATFYVMFAVMTFAAYGVIVHDRTDEARRAGRVYLGMAVGGEALLLAAFLLMTRGAENLDLSEVPLAVASSPRRNVICWLLFAGFGVKAGVVPLHVWLPLAHPVAPAPASAVLSGTILKMGLLGWLRFMPLGAVPLPQHGATILALGLGSALYAAVVGSMQRDAKTVLAYSSVSQMGFATATLGAGLTSPELADATRASLLVFATHHAFAKSALFLGVPIAKDATSRWSFRLVALGMLVPALAIAGAPLSSGALAKHAMKDVVKAAPFDASTAVVVLSVAAIGSTLLMIRFVTLVMPHHAGAAAAPRAGLWLPWAALIAAGVVVLATYARRSDGAHELLRAGDVASSSWPIAIGALIAWAAARGRRARTPEIPPGDVLALVSRAAKMSRSGVAGAIDRLRAAREPEPSALKQRWIAVVSATLARGQDRAEAALHDVGAVAALLIALLAAWALLR